MTRLSTLAPGSAGGGGRLAALRKLPGMKPPALDVARLDAARFAAEAAQLAGEWSLEALSRLHGSQAPDPRRSTEPPPSVHWSIRGEQRRQAGLAPEVWLHLEARTRVQLQCQRCLQALDTPLEVHQRLRFVHGETQAEQEDADSEEDVLALTRSLDLRTLIEDELLLALPIVPRHVACPEPLTASEHATAPDATEVAIAELEGKPNPFAALSALKRRQ